MALKKQLVPSVVRKMRSFDVQISAPQGAAGTYSATIKPLDSAAEALEASGFRLADSVLDLVGELLTDIIRDRRNLDSGAVSDDEQTTGP